MRLFIAEKPSLAKAIAAVLPGKAENKGSYIEVGDDRVAWCVGHILEQAMPDHYLPDSVPIGSKGSKVWREQDLPIIPQKWALFPVEDKKNNLNTIKNLLQQCDTVVNAGDPDEEGQLLVDEVLLFLGNKKPVTRVLVNDYNETKVKQAIANIRDNDEAKFRGWYRWALARSRYDWLFGLNLTRAYTLRGRALGGSGVLSVGSVQTPTLKIVVDRDRAIENFKPVPYFTLSARIRHANGEFSGAWKPSGTQPGLDGEGRLLDKGIADSIAAKVSGKQGEITLYDKSEKKQHAPLMYSLNALQMAANDRFGYSAQQVLDACQSLYETHKLTTYPRSDCQYLSEAQHAESPQVVKAILANRKDLAAIGGKANLKTKSPVFNDKKVTAHHAIAPTVKEADIGRLSKIESDIYDMVVRSYLAQFFPEYVYFQTVIETVIQGETFRSTGKTPVSAGWKEVYGVEVEEKPADDDEDDASQSLPVVKAGDAATCKECMVSAKKTAPPPRFTEKLLLGAMLNVHSYVSNKEAKKRLKEGDGIGTDATRAAIIEELKRKGFIEPLKGKSKALVSTEKGRSLIDALPDQVRDPLTAGLFKLDLDAVASGNLPFDQFMTQTVGTVTTLCETARTASIKGSAEAGPACPECGKGTLRRIKGSGGFFWGCSRYREDCKATFPDDKGKPGKREERPKQDGPQCPECKAGVMRRLARKDGSGHFWGCSNFRGGCKCSRPDADGVMGDKVDRPMAAASNAPACPDCGKGHMRRIARKDGSGFFWGCSAFRDGCKCSRPDVDGEMGTK